MRLLTLLLLLAWAWSATALTQVRLGAAPAPMRLISPGLSLDEVGPPFPGDVAPGVEEADRMRREGRFMEASQALREVLKGNPLDATALAILGQTEMRLGQVEEGERLCREALRIAPGPRGCSTGWGTQWPRQAGSKPPRPPSASRCGAIQRATPR